MATLYKSAVVTTASALGLSHLEEHAGLILGGFVLWCSLQLLSPLLFNTLLPKHYPKLSSKTRKAFDVHFVAFMHALYSAPVAGWLLLYREKQPGLVAQPLTAYDPTIAKVGAISTGYFLWDAIISATNYGGSGGFGFIVHGVGCFAAFLNAQRPFALYFLPVFLFWEASSIFLNLHWVMDKVGLTGSRWQLVNGVVLISTFFFYYSSYQFFRDTSKAAVRLSTPDWVVNGYRIANIALNGLNTYWLVQVILWLALQPWLDPKHDQMIKSVKKRFDAPGPSAKAQGKKRA